MKFEELLNRYFKALDQGRKVAAAKLKPFVEAYLQVIGSGIDPAKARRIMDLYLE